MENYLGKWLSVTAAKEWVKDSLSEEKYYKQKGNKKASDFATKFYFEIIPLSLYAQKTGAEEIFFVDEMAEYHSFDGLMKYPDGGEQKFECTKAISEGDAKAQHCLSDECEEKGFVYRPAKSIPLQEWREKIATDIKNAIGRKKEKASDGLYEDFYLIVTLDSTLAKVGSIEELKIIAEKAMLGYDITPFRKIIIYTKTEYSCAQFVCEYPN